ncbi:hypothetical protein QE152_g23740 [Popillia japonica]|uniref:Uncharacterized protein n=1 Tax=Popillia japonica TaxID=7064 RepID=A0AAW1KGJ4_POPJA
MLACINARISSPITVDYKINGVKLAQCRGVAILFSLGNWREGNDDEEYDGDNEKKRNKKTSSRIYTLIYTENTQVDQTDRVVPLYECASVHHHAVLILARVPRAHADCQRHTEDVLLIINQPPTRALLVTAPKTRNFVDGTQSDPLGLRA